MVLYQWINIIVLHILEVHFSTVLVYAWTIKINIITKINNKPTDYRSFFMPVYNLFYLHPILFPAPKLHLHFLELHINRIMLSVISHLPKWLRFICGFVCVQWDAGKCLRTSSLIVYWYVGWSVSSESLGLNVCTMADFKLLNLYLQTLNWKETYPIRFLGPVQPRLAHSCIFVSFFAIVEFQFLLFVVYLYITICSSIYLLINNGVTFNLRILQIEAWIFYQVFVWINYIVCLKQILRNSNENCK